jgi:hypothetical protein
VTRYARLTSTNDRYESHQHCKHDHRKQTRNDTEDNRRDIVDPLEPGESLGEKLNLRDDTNESDGNCEEDDAHTDESGRSQPSDPVLSGSNTQVVPHNLLGEHTELTGRHLRVGLGLPLLHQQPGILSRPLGVEFQENSADELGLALPVLVLLGLDLGDELGQVLASVSDGVDLLADEELETVGRAVLGVGEVVDAFSGLVRFLSLLRLDAVQVGIAGELDFAVLELHGGVVPVVD